MRLTELGAQWVRHLEDGRRRFIVAVDERAEANGIRFKCPTCVALGLAIVAHTVLLWDPSVRINVDPGPERWQMTGSSFEDLSFDRPVRLRTDCKASFRIVAGEVQPCS